MELTLAGYRHLLAGRLRRAGCRRPERLAERFLRRALRTANGPHHAALDRAWREGARAARRRDLAPLPDPPSRLLCDASLGGLARWLRAAGHDAEHAAGLGGAALLERAVRNGALLLTSDSRVLSRRAVVRGEPRVSWVPVHLPPPEQLALVFEELGLRRAEPRCMRCGGELWPAEKSAVAERIPPRTAAWLDAYFVCRGCDGLFWRGTHWQRIEQRLPR